MSRHSFLCLSAVVLLAVAAAPASAAWVVTEVPQQAGWSGDTVLYDINDSGIACGLGNYVSSVSSVAIRFDGTTVTELPYLHPAPATYPFAWASAINSNGLIAGRSHDAKGVDRAVIWDGANITLIPYPADANTNGDMRAYGINDAGVAVGYYVSTTTGHPAAFYYDGTTHSMVTALQAVGLGTTGNQSYADDVNNNSIICGEGRDTSGEYSFYTYDIGTGLATNLGRMFVFEGCHASAINDSGQVIGRGRSYLGSPLHALLHDGAFNIIDDTIAVAQWSAGITNAGRVAGHADTSTNKWSWYSDAPGTGSMRTINLPGWSALALQGINNGDVMVGCGRTTASPDDDRGCIIAPPPGDKNHDSDVDLPDFAVFQACFTTTGPVSTDCQEFDFDDDGNVDGDDYAIFASSIDGPTE